MTPRYTRTAIFLHWLMGLGLIGTFALGFYMEGLPLSPNKLKSYSWHKWAGISLLVLAVIRLAWRMSHRAPDFRRPCTDFHDRPPMPPTSCCMSCCLPSP